MDEAVPGGLVSASHPVGARCSGGALSGRPTAKVGLPSHTARDNNAPPWLDSGPHYFRAVCAYLLVPCSKLQESRDFLRGQGVVLRDSGLLSM